MLERFPSYRHDGNFRAWVFQILKNELRSRRRRQGRAPEIDGLGPNGRPLEPVDDTVDLEGLVMEHRWSLEVRDALADLPETYRTTVFLKDVEGFAYREIADIVDCPLGTVMSRLARGRSLLRASLLRQARERGLVGRIRRQRAG